MNNTTNNILDELFNEIKDYPVELGDFLRGVTDDKHTNIKKCTEKLNTPEGIALMHYMLVSEPETWETYDITKVKPLNSKFYEKLLALYKMTYDTINYTEKKSEECYDSSKMYTDSEINSCNEAIQKIENQINDKNTGLNALYEKVDERENNIENKIKSNVYSEFIAILGIFTAITFAIFGGMNLLSNLFQNIGSTPASLGQTLILASIFGLIMWGIIELLFNWISKIKEPLNQSENGKKEDNKKEECLCQKVRRISLIKPVWIIVLLIILGIGIRLFIYQ